MKKTYPVMLAYNGDDWTDEDLRKDTTYLISNKINGIRAWGSVVQGKLALATRTPHKYIVNRFAQERFCELKYSLAGYDGELIIPGCTFHETSGILRSKNDTRGTEAIWCLFDYIEPGLPYSNRFRPGTSMISGTHLLKQWIYHAPGYERALEAERDLLNTPFEGYMVRDANANYKFGRTTKKEASLFKLVATVEDVAEIVGMSARISEETGKPLDTLGSITCERVSDGMLFSIGTGFTQDQARRWWRDNLVRLQGTRITFKYKPAMTQDKPAQPVYVSGLP